MVWMIFRWVPCQGKSVFLEPKKEEKIHRKTKYGHWTMHPACGVWHQRHIEVGSCCSIHYAFGGGGHGIRCNSDEAMESHMGCFPISSLENSVCHKPLCSHSRLALSQPNYSPNLLNPYIDAAESIPGGCWLVGRGRGQIVSTRI